MNKPYSNRTLFKISDSDFQKLLDTSGSFAEVIQKVGLSIRGSTHIRAIKKRIQIGQFDTTKLDENRKKKLSENARNTHKKTFKELDTFLTENSSISRNSLKKRLVREGLLEYKCDCCGISTWRDKPIVLQLDHINGVFDDNRLQNLRFLCPNCHSQTSTFTARNMRIGRVDRKEYNVCECGALTKASRKYCDECRDKLRKMPKPAERKCIWPTEVELQKLVWEKPTMAIAKQFGVSDNAVAKWCKKYGIEKPARGYWEKKRWNKI